LNRKRHRIWRDGLLNLHGCIYRISKLETYFCFIKENYALIHSTKIDRMPRRDTLGDYEVGSMACTGKIMKQEHKLLIIIIYYHEATTWSCGKWGRERERERGVRLVCEDKWIGGLSSQIPRTCPDISSMHQLLLICILLVKILSRGYYNFIFHRVFLKKKKTFFLKNFSKFAAVYSKLAFR